MKKVLIFIVCLLTCFALWLVFHDSQNDENETNVVNFINGKSLDSVDVERTIQMDKEYMFMNYAHDSITIRWFESCYKMSDFLDVDSNSFVCGMANVFQVQQKMPDGGSVVNVYAIGHTKEGVDIKIEDDNFWVEDYNLFEYTDSLITFNKAYECMKYSNYKMPHSKNITLRWQIGPNKRNTYAPQYIFGNPDEKYFVDGKTGKVSSENPSGVPEGDSEPY